MPDAVPDFELGLGKGAEKLILFGELGQAADMAGLLRLAPALAAPEQAAKLAIAANHLAQGNEFEVIEDPSAFEDSYRARIETEDPAAEWSEGVIRLCDFGLPNFAEITPPTRAGRGLVFYAVQTYLGLPYKAETSNLKVAPTYEPMDLEPVTRSEPAA